MENMLSLKTPLGLSILLAALLALKVFVLKREIKRLKDDRRANHASFEETKGLKKIAEDRLEKMKGLMKNAEDRATSKLKEMKGLMKTNSLKLEETKASKKIAEGRLEKMRGLMKNAEARATGSSSKLEKTKALLKTAEDRLEKMKGLMKNAKARDSLKLEETKRLMKIAEDRLEEMNGSMKTAEARASLKLEEERRAAATADTKATAIIQRLEKQQGYLKVMIEGQRQKFNQVVSDRIEMLNQLDLYRDLLEQSRLINREDEIMNRRLEGHMHSAQIQANEYRRIAEQSQVSIQVLLEIILKNGSDRPTLHSQMIFYTDQIIDEDQPLLTDPFLIEDGTTDQPVLTHIRSLIKEIDDDTS